MTAALAGTTEALTLSRAYGLEDEAVCAAVGAGTGASWVLEHWPWMRSLWERYEPGNSLDILVKDIRGTLAQAEVRGVELPVTEHAFSRLLETWNLDASLTIGGPTRSGSTSAAPSPTSSSWTGTAASSSTRRRARRTTRRGVLRRARGARRVDRACALRVPRAGRADRPRHDRDDERRPHGHGREDGAADDRAASATSSRCAAACAAASTLRQQVRRAAVRSSRATCACPFGSAWTCGATSGRLSTRRACARRSPRAAGGRRGDRGLLPALLPRARPRAARPGARRGTRPWPLPRGLVGDPAAGAAERPRGHDGDERVRRAGAPALRRAADLGARGCVVSRRAARDAVERRRRDARLVTRNPATTVLSGPAGGPVSRRSPSPAGSAPRTASSSTWAERASTRRSSRRARCR